MEFQYSIFNQQPFTRWTERSWMTLTFQFLARWQEDHSTWQTNSLAILLTYLSSRSTHKVMTFWKSQRFINKNFRLRSTMESLCKFTSKFSMKGKETFNQLTTWSYQGTIMMRLFSIQFTLMARKLKSFINCLHSKVLQTLWVHLSMEKGFILLHAILIQETLLLLKSTGPSLKHLQMLSDLFNN